MSHHGISQSSDHILRFGGASRRKQSRWRNYLLHFYQPSEAFRSLTWIPVRWRIYNVPHTVYNLNDRSRSSINSWTYTVLSARKWAQERRNKERNSSSVIKRHLAVLATTAGGACCWLPSINTNCILDTTHTIFLPDPSVCYAVNHLEKCHFEKHHNYPLYQSVLMRIIYLF